jgi:hypothetical protein
LLDVVVEWAWDSEEEGYAVSTNEESAFVEKLFNMSGFCGHGMAPVMVKGDMFTGLLLQEGNKNIVVYVGCIVRDKDGLSKTKIKNP